MKHEIEVRFSVRTKIEIEAESREEAEAKIKALDFDQINDELAWLNENVHPTAFLISNVQVCSVQSPRRRI